MAGAEFGVLIWTTTYDKKEAGDEPAFLFLGVSAAPAIPRAIGISGQRPGYSLQAPRLSRGQSMEAFRCYPSREMVHLTYEVCGGPTQQFFEVIVKTHSLNNPLLVVGN